VPRDNIIGKPLIIYWSYDAPTEALSNPTIGHRPPGRPDGALLHQDTLGADFQAGAWGKRQLSRGIGRIP
jgi:hypothetical protein